MNKKGNKVYLVIEYEERMGQSITPKLIVTEYGDRKTLDISTQEFQTEDQLASTFHQWKVTHAYGYCDIYVVENKEKTVQSLEETVQSLEEAEKESERLTEDRKIADITIRINELKRELALVNYFKEKLAGNNTAILAINDIEEYVSLKQAASTSEVKLLSSENPKSLDDVYKKEPGYMAVDRVPVIQMPIRTRRKTPIKESGINE